MSDWLCENIIICKILVSFDYFWSGARYLIANYIATENEDQRLLDFHSNTR